MRSLLAFSVAAALCLISAAAADSITLIMPAAPVSSGFAVPRGFTGFSGPEGTLFNLLMRGSDGTSLLPRPSFTRLMSLLDAPNLRFGHFYASAYPQYGGIEVNASTGAAIASALASFNGSLTGIIMPLDRADGTFLADSAAALLQYVGRPTVLAVEAANEPDISSFLHNYSGYQDVFGLWAGGLAKAGLPVPLLDAPVLASGGWWPNMTTFLGLYGTDLVHFVQHRYPLSACHGAVNSPAKLMRTNLTWANASIPPSLLATITRTYGLPFVVGEGNTVACNGSIGTSDVFASALYALDASFNALAGNFSRYNWHGLGTPYPTFSYQPLYYNTSYFAQPGWDEAEVRPLWYGLWALTEAAPAGALVVQPAVVKSTNPYLVPWATIQQQQGQGQDGWVGSGGGYVVRVSVLHKDPDAAPGSPPANVTVQPTPACVPGQDSATLTRLLSGQDGLGAREGISYRGLTFDGTKDGIPVPAPGSAAVEDAAAAASLPLSPRPLTQPASESVPCTGAGVFSFTLPPASAAFLAYTAAAAM